MVDHLVNQEGLSLKIHDPKVTEEGFLLEMEAQGYDIEGDKENNPNQPAVKFCGADVEEAVEGCDTLVVMTEWDEFKKYDYRRLTEIMKNTT